jgi:hypothetical protein
MIDTGQLCRFPPEVRGMRTHVTHLTTRDLECVFRAVTKDAIDRRVCATAQLGDDTKTIAKIQVAIHPHHPHGYRRLMMVASNAACHNRTVGTCPQNLSRKPSLNAGPAASPGRECALPGDEAIAFTLRSSHAHGPPHKCHQYATYARVIDHSK